MVVKKFEIRPKGNGTYNDIWYPKTSADIVIADDGESLQQKLAYILTTANLGAANGAAPLGADSKIPITYMPTTTSVETRTNDPASPAIGRMWLRTDL